MLDRQDRRKPVMTRAELAPDRAIRAAANKYGAETLVKVRVADALAVDGSGLPNDIYGYALRAHFDFLVVEGAQRMPQFAVEFDDPSHERPEVAARDQKKDMICRSLGLPLLRIDSTFLRRAREATIVGWLIEVWFTEQAFYRVQDEGQIPEDEPFMYFSVLEPAADGRWRSLALDAEARLELARAHAEGLLRSHVPEEIKTPFYERTQAECYAVAQLDNERYLIGYAKVRGFDRFGVSASELASDLAVADLGVRLRRHREGKLEPAGSVQIAGLRKRTAGWNSMGAPVSPPPLSDPHRRRNILLPPGPDNLAT